MGRNHAQLPGTKVYKFAPPNFTQPEYNQYDEDREVEAVSPIYACNERIPCALCTLSIYGYPHTFPSTMPAAAGMVKYALSLPSDSSMAFCLDCWTHVYNLSICWKCGEMVFRSEERIGLGWCWWHWGCVSCLSCWVSAQCTGAQRIMTGVLGAVEATSLDREVDQTFESACLQILHCERSGSRSFERGDIR